MEDTRQPHSSLRTVVVWDVLRSALADHQQAIGQDRLDVVDLGGGTGGFAVPLAVLGHQVTVIDPSPDALAALERRAAEASTQVAAKQGDLADASGLLGPEFADVVLCHGVLEYVDDPMIGCVNAANLLRPGGIASVLVANQDAAVVGHALSGQINQALAIVQGLDRESSPPRKFTEDQLRQLLTGSGLVVRSTHGVRMLANIVAGSGGDASSHSASFNELVTLEGAVSSLPQYRALAAQIHMLAQRVVDQPN